MKYFSSNLYKHVKLSKESGVNVVMGTGYYVDGAQSNTTKGSSVEDMCNFMENELR